jgi:hypothetical protein
MYSNNVIHTSEDGGSLQKRGFITPMINSLSLLEMLAYMKHIYPTIQPD